MGILGRLLCVVGLVGVAGCKQYPPPEQSGLVAVRPFPVPNHVCQVLGESAATSAYLDHTTLLIGCPTHERGAIRQRILAGAQELDRVGAWTLLSHPLFDPSDAGETLQTMSAKFANKTILTYSQAHGTQVEYHDAKGNVSLWYPGNTSALPGKWHLQGETAARAEMCYKYGTNTRNPVTGVRGAVWQCRSVTRLESTIKETLAGDPFSLASGTIPFILEKGAFLSSATLKQRAKK